jgi:hypothetical protein
LESGPTATELGRRPQPFELARLELHAGGPGGDGRIGVEAVHVGVEGVHHHPGQAHAHPVLELVGGLDGLVDRRLLGDGDQQDLAA